MGETPRDEERHVVNFQDKHKNIDFKKSLSLMLLIFILVWLEVNKTWKSRKVMLKIELKIFEAIENQLFRI